MNRPAIALAYALIRASQHTIFKGLGGDYGATPDQLASANPRQRYRQAICEADQVGDFYAIFPNLRREMRDRDVLDLGCGYGGKTVEYASVARTVAGIEPFAHMLDLARGFAGWRNAKNVRFDLCVQDRIPFPDASFDIIVSHDVLEHVDNPEVTLREVLRVLRPGGRAFIAFPPYDGALSHHLDYVCRVPGLHWLFSPETLVAAVNRVLVADRHPVRPQPAPKLAWDGSRKVLPSLNGLTARQFDEISAGFAARSVRTRMVAQYRHGFYGMVRRFAFRPLAALGVREPVTASIHAVLSKASAPAMRRAA